MMVALSSTPIGLTPITVEKRMKSHAANTMLAKRFQFIVVREAITAACAVGAVLQITEEDQAWRAVTSIFKTKTTPWDWN